MQELLQWNFTLLRLFPPFFSPRVIRFEIVRLTTQIKVNDMTDGAGRKQMFFLTAEGSHMIVCEMIGRWVSEVCGDSRRVSGLWIFDFYSWFLKVESDFFFLNGVGRVNMLLYF